MVAGGIMIVWWRRTGEVVADVDWGEPKPSELPLGDGLPFTA